MDSYWRRNLPRLGRGVFDVFADLYRAIRDQGLYFLQIDDIKDCYPSAPLNKIIECQHRGIQQPDLRHLTELITRGYEGRDNTTGIGQGSPYSPVAMEALLHDFDTGLEARCQGTSLLFRYVDNLTWLVRNTSQGRTILRLAEELLNEWGFELKGEGGCIDLRDSQHTTKLLGLIPRWENGQLKLYIPNESLRRSRELLT